MIYQLLLFTKGGDNLTSWSKEGFPEERKLKRDQILKNEKLKQIASNIAPVSDGREVFKSINFGKVTASFLFKDKITYTLVSDKSDPVKARKRVLRDIAGNIKTYIKDLKEGKELENLDKFMTKKIHSHTRPLASIRSGVGGSFLFGFLGGLLFIFAFSLIEGLMRTQILPGPKVEVIALLEPLALEILKIFEWMSLEWLKIIIFFSIFSFLIGIVVGLASGKSSEAFLGCYILLMLIFSISIYSRDPIISSISLLYTSFFSKNIRILWQILFLIGISFGLLSALVGAGIGHILDTRSLLGVQIPKKPTKKAPREKKKEKEEEEIEEIAKEEEETEEEVEIGEEELKELEELFGEE